MGSSPLLPGYDTTSVSEGRLKAIYEPFKKIRSGAFSHLGFLEIE